MFCIELNYVGTFYHVFLIASVLAIVVMFHVSDSLYHGSSHLYTPPPKLSVISLMLYQNKNSCQAPSTPLAIDNSFFAALYLLTVPKYLGSALLR